jgi:3-oxoacyl-[acyl-carrier protein] reductase
VNILVSGGSKGLGAAIVRELLAHGHTVATFSRVETDFLREVRSGEHGVRLVWQSLDVADREGMNAFVIDFVKQHRQLDALVNNVAVAVDGPFTLMRPDDVRRLLQVNVEGAIHLAQSCARRMIQRRFGCILNISSIVGTRGHSGLAVYSATKAALDGLTRALARELGPLGIRVNSIAPGYIETEMSASLAGNQREQVRRRTPLGRLGKPEDIVGAVEFFLSPAASFISGQTLVIDGGLTC